MKKKVEKVDIFLKIVICAGKNDTKSGNKTL